MTGLLFTSDVDLLAIQEAWESRRLQAASVAEAEAEEEELKLEGEARQRSIEHGDLERLVVFRIRFIFHLSMRIGYQIFFQDIFCFAIDICQFISSLSTVMAWLSRGYLLLRLN